MKLISPRESFADQYLVSGAGRDEFALAKIQSIELRLPLVRQRYHMRGKRLSAAMHGHGHILSHARFDQADARYRRDRGGNRQRDTLGTGKDRGKVCLVIEHGLGGEQRLVCRHCRHKHGDPAGHDQGNGYDLAAHPAKIARELAIQHAHQLISSADSRLAFATTRAMVPSARCTTRSAIPAIAALWVMTTAVVPSSRLIRAMAARTTTPVR